MAAFLPNQTPSLLLHRSSSSSVGSKPAAIRAWFSLSARWFALISPFLCSSCPLRAVGGPPGARRHLPLSQLRNRGRPTYSLNCQRNPLTASRSVDTNPLAELPGSRPH